MTVRHRGGGAKRAYRRIDFKRDKWDVPARLATIEYDPNRSARIGLLHYADGEKRYILVPQGLRGRRHRRGRAEGRGARRQRAAAARDPARHPVIHNIELVPGKGGQIVRSAGASAQLMAKEGDKAQVRLPSGEVRRVDMRCMATVGQVGNLEHENQNLGKAGRSRHMGRRPAVRGVVMNPRDHPHGGGEGKSPDRHAAQDPLGPARDGPPDPDATRPAGGSSCAPGTARARQRRRHVAIPARRDRSSSRGSSAACRR